MNEIDFRFLTQFEQRPKSEFWFVKIFPLAKGEIKKGSAL